jgi:hypothetical protein
MGNLLKSSQGMSFYILCFVYICHMIWHVTATDVYFFDRDLESHKLRFDYNNTWDICSEKQDPACVKPKSYLSSTIFLPIYQVLELILNKTNNSSFTVFDQQIQTWYLVYNGTSKPLEQASEELKNVQLSIVYYTNMFFLVPYAKLWVIIATTLAILFTMIAMFSALVLMLIRMYDHTDDRFKYLLNNRYLPRFLWMFSSTVLFGTILIRLLVTINYRVDEWSIALISTMVSWSSTSFILWIITREIDNSLLRLRLVTDKKRGILNLGFLLLALILLLMPVIFSSFDLYILGSDDASLQTGYSYLNTLIEPIDNIKFM